MRIAVCILTYKRMEGLKKALQSLISQKDNGGIFRICKIVVVDNEVNSEIELLCHTMSDLMAFNISYIPEHKRGIAYARNAAVAASKKDVDCIAFLDDDEEAAGDWLYELASAMEESNADIVTGNIISIFDHDTPDWVLRGQFFDRFIHRHLERIKYARTGNVLIRISVFDKCGYFDENFSLTGGEDTIFFNKANAVGEKIVWSSKAIVHESVDKNRCNVRWILKRAFRTKGTTVISNIMLSNNKMILGLQYFILGTINVVCSLIIAPIAVFAGYVAFVRAMRMSARGLGMILGLFGYHYKEYAEK